MSEATSQRVAEAKAAVTEQEKIVDSLIEECLTAVAAGIPGGAEKYAKEIAHAQPEVTKELGRDGIGSLRQEIATYAADLAAELKESATAIQWPLVPSRKDDVSSALFYFLYGTRMEQFDVILRRAGYRIGENGGLNPHSIFNLRQFTDLNEQLAVLAARRGAVELALAADDRDTVDDLWG